MKKKARAGNNVLKPGKFTTFIREKRRFIFFLLILISLAWRIIYLLEMEAGPYGSNLTMDALYHDQWAREIASGTWEGEEPFFRAPLYPFFLGAIYFLTGGSQIAARIVQILMGAGSCFLMYLIAKRIFNEETGIIAWLISAVYGMFLYFENELLIVTLIVFLDLWALYLLLRLKEEPQFRYFFFAGFLLGLSAIARPNILFFCIVLPVWLVIVLRKQLKPGVLLARMAVGMLGILLPIIPVMTYNAVAGHDFVPIASQGGVNFYIGNNEYSDGRTAIVPGTRESWWGGYEDQIRMARKALGDEKAPPSAISSYWFKQGGIFIFTQPGKAFALTLKKLYMFWNGYEIGNNRDVNFATRYSVLYTHFSVKFWFIVPFAFAGFYLAWKAKHSVSLFLFFILSYMASIVPFFINARFRMPVIPPLIILCAYGLYELVSRIKKSKPSYLQNRNIRWAWLLLLLAVPLVWPLPQRDNLSQAYFHEALAFQDKGRFHDAVEAFEKSIAADPGNIKSMVNKGVIYLVELKDYKGAEEAFLQVLSISPENLKALYNLALTYKEAGDLRYALEYYDKAIVAGERDVQREEVRGILYGSYRGAGGILEAINRPDEAARAYAAALKYK